MDKSPPIHFSDRASKPESPRDASIQSTIASLLEAPPAAASRIFDVSAREVAIELSAVAESWVSGSDLRHDKCSRRTHDTCSEKVPRVDSEPCIRGENAPGHGSESTTHNCHQLGARHLIDIGFNDQGRLSLSDKDIARSGKAFGTTGTHGSTHHRSDCSDQGLNNPQMIENRHESTKENNCRQNLEGEDHANRGWVAGGCIHISYGTSIGEFPKDETGTLIGKREYFLNKRFCCFENPTAWRCSQDKKRKEKLEPKPPEDETALNGMTVAGEEVSDQ